MKKCSKCKELKPLAEFGKDTSRRDGFNSCCKECRSLERKEWYTHNKEHRKEWYLAHREGIKKNKEENKERTKAVRQKWNEGNKQKIIEYNKAYYAKNKEKINKKNGEIK